MPIPRKRSSSGVEEVIITKKGVGISGAAAVRPSIRGTLEKRGSGDARAADLDLLGSTGGLPEKYSPCVRHPASIRSSSGPQYDP